MENAIPDQLSTLGHPQRLAVFRLLMRRYPDRVPAGELAAALGIKASTMSTYLAALGRADLVVQERAGTSLLYAIHMSAVQRMFATLMVDCCRGRADICMPHATGADAMPSATGAALPEAAGPRRIYKVLFICTGNSARSIFAETLLRRIGGDRFEAFSAGTRPGSQLNPFAVQLLRDKGHDVSMLRSKDISEFSGGRTDGTAAPQFDFVFTVCNQAANEDCPAWDGQPVSGHWGLPDPAKAIGTDAAKALAFQQAYGALKHRIEAFAALPFESLDRIALQHAVDDIGRLAPGVFE